MNEHGWLAEELERRTQELYALVPVLDEHGQDEAARLLERGLGRINQALAVVRAAD